ncbi:MAG: cell division protein FtsL [Burkholderiales bacterium]
MTTRLNILLLLVLVASAAYLVRTSYEGRRLFIQLERERVRTQALANETEGLQIDRREHATHLLVERVARQRLGMRGATAAVTQYVDGAASEGNTGPAQVLPPAGGGLGVARPWGPLGATP